MPDASPLPTAPTGHSPWGMSVLDRRLACPGSASAEAGRTDRRSSAADRGTFLHDCAAQALLTGQEASDLLGLADDDDGIGIVQPYLDAVRAAHTRLGGKLHVEKRFHLSSVSDLLWGTSDAVIVAPPRLAVLDLKTGGHRVPITRADGGINLQLAGYAMAAMEGVPFGVVIDAVEVSIIQPRLNLLQSVDVDVVDLFSLAADLQDAIAASFADDAPLHPGDHCRYCRAAADCPALQAFVRRTAGGDFTDPTDPGSMTPAELGAVLDAAELLDVWVGAVRQQARAEADRGRMPHGYKLVERRGRRKWADDAEERVVGLLADLGLPPAVAYSAELRSPAQLEAVAKKAKVKLPDAWQGLITTTSPGLALVQATDPRPPVANGTAADFIDHVQEA